MEIWRMAKNKKNTSKSHARKWAVDRAFVIGKRFDCTPSNDELLKAIWRHHTTKKPQTLKLLWKSQGSPKDYEKVSQGLLLLDIKYMESERPRISKTKTGRDFYQSNRWKRLRYQVLSISNGVCELCGSGADDGIKLHVDHIKPRSKYPELALDINNMQVLCSSCNIGKSNIDETDWRGIGDSEETTQPVKFITRKN